MAGRDKRRHRGIRSLMGLQAVVSSPLSFSRIKKGSRSVGRIIFQTKKEMSNATKNRQEQQQASPTTPMIAVVTPDSSNPISTRTQNAAATSSITINGMCSHHRDQDNDGDECNDTDTRLSLLNNVSVILDKDNNEQQMSFEVAAHAEMLIEPSSSVEFHCSNLDGQRHQEESDSEDDFCPATKSIVSSSSGESEDYSSSGPGKPTRHNGSPSSVGAIL
jgi:hypothetical protein